MITFMPKFQKDLKMKKTALSSLHEELGAKMVDFAGFYMPVQYAGLKHEHEVVRTGVGVFDVSHMGNIYVRGENAERLLQKVCSNDISKLVVGKAQYNYLPNKEGGIVDDLIVYKIAENDFLLVANASNIEKDWNWLVANNNVGADLVNESDQWSIFAIQGPKAAEAMQSLTSVNLSDMKFYSFELGEFAGINAIISATGYTGSGGFEVYVKNEDAKEVWDRVFEAGKSFNIEPIGLGARDTLRLEMGYCLYGNDIDDTTNPFEAGLGWITKFTKDFTNSENLKASKEAGLKNKLVGFELIDRGVPRHGYPIQDKNGNEIGRVTSGTMSPSLDKAIGMGYVSIDYATEGTEIFIGVRNKSLKAQVVKTPFYKG